MVRTLISLPDQKLKQLDVLARRNKKSRAQVVREAVDLYLNNNDRRRESWHELVRQTAGIGKGYFGDDAVEYVRKLRAEWEK